MAFLRSKLKSSLAQSFQRESSMEEIKIDPNKSGSDKLNKLMDSQHVLQTENSESSTRMTQEVFDAEMCCLELQIASNIIDPRDKRKMIYCIKISDVDRYQPKNQYSGQKIFEW